MAKDEAVKRSKLTRRAVLASAGAVAGGAAIAAACKYRKELFLLSGPPKADTQSPAWEGSRVERFRTLGSTGFQMSDISFGCSGLSDAAVARRARGARHQLLRHLARLLGRRLGEGARRGHPRFAARPPVRGLEVLHAEGAPGERHAGSGGRRRGRGEPEAARHRLPRPRAHPRGELDRPTDGAEHPRSVRSPRAGRQGALPRRLQPHARPGDGHAARRRQRPLRRHHGRLQLRELARSARHLPARPPARHGRRGDEDAEGRLPQPPRRVHPDGARVLRRRRPSSGFSRTTTSAAWWSP